MTGERRLKRYPHRPDDLYVIVSLRNGGSYEAFHSLSQARAGIRAGRPWPNRVAVLRVPVAVHMTTAGATMPETVAS